MNTHTPSPAAFQLLAAIDLRGGRVVRLREGDFARETIYASDPAVAAAALVDRGARWLHVVDLDAARTGERRHGAELRAIIGAVAGRAAVEVAGGIRDEAAAAGLLAAGAARVVLGTAALRDPGFVSRVIGTHGSDAVAIALDVRDGVPMADGWATRGTEGVREVLARLMEAGATTFEVTAIERDGSLGGPDLGLLADCVAQGAARVVASGGIRDVADVVRTRDAGCGGAIVGRALYEGSFDLAEAVRLTS